MDLLILSHLQPPRVGPPPAALTARTRALLDELAELFLSEGFSHLTLADIEARLQCSRRTLYGLAPSKNELVVVVFDRLLRRFGRTTLDHLETLADPGDRVEAFLVWATSNLQQVSLRFSEDLARDPAVREVFAAHYRYGTAVIALLIEEGVACGRFRPLNTRIAAEVIGASLEQLNNPDVLQATGMEWTEVLTELATFIRGGLLMQGAGH
jgi:AcrR family transcriptional regulator